MNNKKILFLLPIAMLACLASCNEKESKINLTYGSYVDETFVSLSYSELETKAIVEKENMMVVTHAGGLTGGSCTCWVSFKGVIQEYIQKEHVRVYLYDTTRYEATNGNFGMTISTKDEPNLFIFSNGKMVKKYLNSDRNNYQFFHEYKDFKEEIDQKINKPHIYFVDQDDIDSKISNNDKFTIGYVRESCPDCTYCLPNVILPFIENETVNKDLYLFDLDPYYENKDEYSLLKDKYQLSETNNTDYGYETGVVPTFQNWNNGKLYDADVYFNDEITLNNENNKYLISTTYFTEERINKLHYLENVETKVLEGLEVGSDDINDYGEYGIYWKQEKAAQYHDPLLKAFLKKYLA